MDLKINVYCSPECLLENKTCFKETMHDVPDDFGYANLVKAFKSVFGNLCVIQFCII